MKLGDTKPVTWTEDGHEHRSRLDAQADCPGCGAEIECWADTEAWVEGKDGRWHHHEYGGAMGFCDACDLLIADCLSDGFRAIKLEQPHADPQGA